MCYEFSLFSNLSRVARFYIDGVSGSEKYAVASAVSRTSGLTFICSLRGSSDRILWSPVCKNWILASHRWHKTFFILLVSNVVLLKGLIHLFKLSFISKYIFFYKGSYLPVLVGGFCTQPEIPEFKRKKINSQTVNSGLNSILQGWGVTAWVGEGGAVFNLIWESIKSWDWVWKVKQRKYIRCTDMLEMDLRGQWATVGQIPIFSFLLHPWWCSRSQTCP